MVETKKKMILRIVACAAIIGIAIWGLGEGLPSEISMGVNILAMYCFFDKPEQRSSRRYFLLAFLLNLMCFVMVLYFPALMHVRLVAFTLVPLVMLVGVLFHKEARS